MAGSNAGGHLFSPRVALTKLPGVALAKFKLYVSLGGPMHGKSASSPIPPTLPPWGWGKGASLVQIFPPTFSVPHPSWASTGSISVSISYNIHVGGRYVHMSKQVSVESKRTHYIPWSWSSGGCEPPNIGTGAWDLVLGKSTPCS